LSEQTTTPSPQPVTPTNKTQVTKLDDKQVKLLPDCSTNPDSSVKKESGYTTTDKVVYVTTDGKSFCTTPLEEK
jgi:hypothetical protein